MNQLTELLGRIQAGDMQARDALFAAAYTVRINSHDDNECGY
jgi:hypothetical protein